MFVLLQVRRAVRALGGFDRDLAQAEGALLGGGRLGGLGLLADGGQLVEYLDDDEQHQRGDDEVDDRAHKVGRRQAPGPLGLADEDLLGLGAHDPGQQGLDEIVGHAVDDRGERTADDHADGQVDHVAAQGKLLEFSDELLHLSYPPCACTRIFQVSV